jgi:hypothetical protein
MVFDPTVYKSGESLRNRYNNDPDMIRIRSIETDQYIDEQEEEDDRGRALETLDLPEDPIYKQGRTRGPYHKGEALESYQFYISLRLLKRRRRSGRGRGVS